MSGIFSRYRNEETRILELFRDGDPAASRALYDAYAGYLTAVCSRYLDNDADVEDVLQESFMAIFEAVPDFEYRGRGSLKSWMARIVVNRALKHLRDSRRIVFTDIGDIDLPEEPDTESIPPGVIHALIRRLPDGYRTIFNLYVIEERSHREIAKLLGITESTSASQLHRAKAMLAAMIKDYQNGKR
ncbi:MAG: sigma-70 family RNA polymerase sigma factor [Bacteroidales bacterium]|nr:sigma-70 family RNA polymerase sigma factor [Bacteroidales bacterium]